MPEMELDGGKLYYESRGSGIPVILIPGLGTDSSLWHWQINRYSAGFRCIVFDTRGVGRSTLHESYLNESKYTLRLLASDVNSLMMHLDIHAAHIVGASMGGVVAQYFAALFPEKLLSLSLHSTLGKSGPLTSLQFQSQINLLEEISVEKLLLSIAPLIWSEETLLYRNDLLRTFRALKDGSIPMVSKELYILQAKTLLDFDALGGITGIKVPVLITAGSDDILIRPENSERIHQAIPGSEYQIFKGCGHASLVEKHEEFNSVTLAFFEKGEQGA